MSRSEEDGIGLEELDSVQSDLETLLANAGKRLKQLENEIQILQNWQEKNGTVKESIGKVGKTGKVVRHTKLRRPGGIKDNFRALDKRKYLKIIFLISHQNHML